MTKQNEQLIKFFNERGYQPVLFSRTNLTPPDVYDLKDQRYERLGPLQNFLKPQISIPKPDLANAVDFERIDTHARSAQTSFSFFKNLLERFGIGSAEAKAKLGAAADATYRFKDVTISSLNVVDIENILEAGLNKDRFRSEAEGGSIHIAYEYIFAGKVQIINGDHGDFSIGLRADLSQIAQGNIFADKENKDKSSIDYQNSDRPVVIAFKVGQLTLSGTEWKLRVRRSAAGFDQVSSGKMPYVHCKGEIIPVL